MTHALLFNRPCARLSAHQPSTATAWRRNTRGQLLGQPSRLTLRLSPRTMVLKVRLILGLAIVADFGTLCCQKVWVVPFMTRRLPFSSWIEIEGLSPLRLWRRENFLSAPRLREPIAVFCPSAFSSSLCQPMPSLPSWYRLQRHELNKHPTFSSTRLLRVRNSFVQGSAILVVPE